MTSSSSSSLQFLLFISLFISISISNAKTSFRPTALVIPVTKDASTLQYITKINQRTPLVPVNLVIDLGGQLQWVDCLLGYESSSYRPARCKSAQCSLASSGSFCTTCYSTYKPGCSNNTCAQLSDNPFMPYAVSGDIISDIVSLSSTNGSNPGRVVSVPNFLLTCGYTFLLEGLASNVQGIAGFGRSRISLPSQFSAAFSFDLKFAICLTSGRSSTGVVFFGDGPYVMLPGIDISQSLTYTPLIRNPVDTNIAFPQDDGSSEYYIGVKSIKISDNLVPLNKTLLSIIINSRGFGSGGTKISTVNPYTVMETSIYNAFTQAYIKEAATTNFNMTRVASVAPFEVCFSTRNLVSTRVGFRVPSIDLVLQNENVWWRIFGVNSMVSVNDNVVCLGFINGGSNPLTSIVIGGYQLEDNLLQFDLATSRLGFSSTLLFRQTTCANFNFTSSN